MSEKILAALAALDPKNDDQWTADGAPKLEALKLEGIKRADVVKVAPQFSRTNLSLATPAADKDKADKEAEAEAPKKDLLAEALGAKAAAEAVIAKTAEELRVAQQEYAKALAALDDVERTIAAINGNRTSQHDIMDYIAAENARRAGKVAGK